MAWTEERVEELKKLWAEGHSASQIAARMGGVTRNAVIGKVHRLGLSGRAAPAKPKSLIAPQGPEEVEAPRPERSEPRPLRPVLRDLPSISETGIDRATVASIGNDQCKWPIGDPATDDFHFCGQAATGGKPYCAYHTQLAFQPTVAKKDRKRSDTPALPRPVRAVS